MVGYTHESSYMDTLVHMQVNRHKSKNMYRIICFGFRPCFSEACTYILSISTDVYVVKTVKPMDRRNKWTYDDLLTSSGPWKYYQTWTIVYEAHHRGSNPWLYQQGSNYGTHIRCCFYRTERKRKLYSTLSLR